MAVVPISETIEDTHLAEKRTSMTHASTTHPMAITREYAIVDFETTGLFPGRGDRIVEVAVLRVGPNGEITDEFSSLVNPSRLS